MSFELDLTKEIVVTALPVCNPIYVSAISYQNFIDSLFANVQLKNNEICCRELPKHQIEQAIFFRPDMSYINVLQWLWQYLESNKNI